MKIVICILPGPFICNSEFLCSVLHRVEELKQEEMVLIEQVASLRKEIEMNKSRLEEIRRHEMELAEVRKFIKVHARK